MQLSLISKLVKAFSVKALFILFLSCILSACGGGGGTSATATANASLPQGFSGTVAIGAGVQDAEISLRDLDGQIVSTTSDAMGGWIVPFSDIKRKLTPPFVVKAKFKIAGKIVNLFSMSTDDTGGNITMNITPWTDMVTRAYTWPNVNDPNAVEGLENNPGKLKQIITGAKEMAGELLPKTVGDFIKDPFIPDPLRNEHDALIERSRILFDNGNILLTDVNGTQMASRTIGSLSSGTPNASDAGTVSKSEAATAIAVKGAFPTNTPAVVNEGLVTITSVTPTAAVVGQPTNFVIHGKNIGGLNSIIANILNCPDAQDQGGTDTSKTFTCTPTSVGTKTGLLVDANSLRDLFKFSVIVSAPVQSPSLPAVLSISPATAVLNKITTFTILGTNFVEGMRFTLEGCSGNEVIGVGTSTMRQFTCASALLGTNAGQIKDKLDGSVLKDFSILITPATNETCIDSPTSLWFAKYCYVVENGVIKYNGTYTLYFHDGSGVVEWVDEYVNGVLNGAHISYWALNVVALTGTYSNGLQTGAWTTYEVDGSVRDVRNFSSGTQMSIALYCPTGTPAAGQIYSTRVNGGTETILIPRCGAP